MTESPTPRADTDEELLATQKQYNEIYREGYARAEARYADLLEAAIHLRDCIAKRLYTGLALAQLEAAITKATRREQ